MTEPDTTWDGLRPEDRAANLVKGYREHAGRMMSGHWDAVQADIVAAIQEAVAADRREWSNLRQRQSDGLEPYENKLSIEELRRELRECWDREFAICDAIRDAPLLPPPWILLFFSQSGKWPDDYERGKLLQRQRGLDAVPPKTECEIGAGVWSRIRRGLIFIDEGPPS